MCYCDWCPGRWKGCSRCFHFGKSPMTTWERLKLSPFQKWKYYGLPPWKFILSILLVTTTTVTIYELADTITPYQRAQAENWTSMLIPTDDLDSYTAPGSTVTTYYIYSIDTLIEAISSYISIYYTLNTSVVGNYQYLNEYSNYTIDPIKLTIYSYKYPSQVFNPDNNDYDSSTETKEYQLLNATDLGPFNNISNRIHLTHSLISMKLHFKIKNIGYSNAYRTCYVDTVEENYDFYYRGRIELSMNPKIYICTEQYSKSIFNRQYNSLIIFLTITLILSILSEFLQIKAVLKHIEIYRIARKKAGGQSWNHLTFSDKMEFFNLWFITTTISNICNIIGTLWVSSLLLVSSTDTLWDGPLVFIGLGCMFTWISSIQYFEMFPNYYTLILTLKKSAPRVLAFLVGVLPVFLGFAYFGVAYFSIGSELFSNVDQSSVALFALLNGDVIHDIFDNIYPISPVISRIYLYSFISLFIYAVLNIFIAIVEDAFFAAKQETDQEIIEDAGQQNLDIKDLDVVGLVTGPPIPIKNPLDIINNENKRLLSQHITSINHETSNDISTLIPLNKAASSSYDASCSDKDPLSPSDMNYSPIKNVSPTKNIRIFGFNEHKSGADIEYSAPLLSSLQRHDKLSRSERLLLKSDISPRIKERQNKNQKFLKILSKLIQSYNKEFLNEISQILLTYNKNGAGNTIRPPHSFNNFPCGFKDCMYCSIKILLQSNLKILTNNVKNAIDISINNDMSIQQLSTTTAQQSITQLHQDDNDSDTD